MSWRPEYIILIMISTLVDYFVGIKIHAAKLLLKKKLLLGVSLLVNLGLLFTFKYWNFFSESFRELLTNYTIQLDPLTLKILLPVGISFYTFQTLSYTIDIFRGKLKPQKHLGIFAVYVSFFPQLVAGPIERARNLLPQFFEKQVFDYVRVTNGLKLMLWGFFKKVVIADNLAVIVNTVFNDASSYTGLPLIVATIFFAFQIYCDFSGYSDIAIGAAQVMGITLMDNFRRPYFSRSISEFWKRWHISLSTWFKDYLYIPLGGNRVSIPRWYLNLIIVFVVSGLWHGANWTFIVWGALHGSYLILEILLKPLKNRFLTFVNPKNKFPWLVKFIEISITFCLVTFAWIFFRANSLSDAWYIITNLFSNLTLNFSGVFIGADWFDLIIIVFMIGMMELIHVFQEHDKLRYFLSEKPLAFQWFIYLVLVLLILLFGAFDSTQFIYFQF